MGAGLAQIGILVVLTVIGLPLFFFGLMAALDRFEKSLSAAPRTVMPVSPVAVEPVSVVEPGAAVLTLPTGPVVAPAAAATASAGAKPAPAI
ncbi:MAG: hypothetical protein ACRDV3_17025 [Acidothermaceae bacterium]